MEALEELLEMEPWEPQPAPAVLPAQGLSGDKNTPFVAWISETLKRGWWETLP